MKKFLLGLLASAALVLPALADSGSGVGFVTTPPSGSYFNLQTSSPTFVGIAATDLVAWVGSSSAPFGNILVGSGVNQVSISGAATGVDPIITVGGASSDTNIGLLISGKGTAPLHLGGTLLSNASVRVPTVASAVNEISLSGAVTTGVAQITIGGTSSDTNAGINVAGKGTGIATLGTTCTASGTTTATCNGQQPTVTVTGLTTAAAGTTSAAMTVTDSSVVASTNKLVCNVNNYAGTGIPIVSTIIPGTGQFSFTITNVAGSGALNANVPVTCLVVS